MPADGIHVLIQELGPPFRLMTFAGADMPERPLGVAGSQRAVQTWYPGQSKASTQVMGTEEEPIVLRGWFRDPLTILDGGATVRVATLRGIMQGQGLCQLIWGDVVVRKGRVARCDFKFHRTQVVRYEITFEVDQADEVVAVVPLPIVAAVGADLKAGIDEAIAALETGAEVIRGAKAIDAIV